MQAKVEGELGVLVAVLDGDSSVPRRQLQETSAADLVNHPSDNQPFSCICIKYCIKYCLLYFIVSSTVSSTVYFILLYQVQFKNVTNEIQGQGREELLLT